jgi:hypothetical protein
MYVVPNESSHIVLTHVAHKPLVIASSDILSEYWTRLTKALKEAERIILFGYSGTDIHLNEVVIQNSREKEIHIVEWEGAGDSINRQRFWNTQLHREGVVLHRLASILDFQNWNEI